MARMIDIPFEMRLNDPLQRRSTAHVFGPYPNRDKWRLIVISAEGCRLSSVFETFEIAQTVKAKVAELLISEAEQPVGLAIDEFLGVKRKEGLQPVSILGWVRCLASLPRECDLSEVKPSDAQALYDQWTSQLAVATHHARLRRMRSFFAWAIERGYIEKNPFTGVKAVGRAHRGKPQPRVDEARKLHAELCRLAWAGESAAACLLVQILIGLRSSEVLRLRVRDVDADGTLLHVAAQGGKTSNAPRILESDAPDLRALLLHYSQGRVPTDYLLFPGQSSTKRTNEWLYRYLHRLCDRLSIPRACPHALRGLHATLAVKAGVSARAVADVLGHGSDEITKRHYIAPGADRAGASRELAALLAPAPSAQLEELPDT